MKNRSLLSFFGVTGLGTLMSIASGCGDDPDRLWLPDPSEVPYADVFLLPPGGAELVPVETEEGDAPADEEGSAWELDLPQGEGDPETTGGEPIDVDSIPAGSVLTVVWSVWDIQNQNYGLDEVRIPLDSPPSGFPSAFHLAIDEEVAPPVEALNTNPWVFGIDESSSALGFAWIFLLSPEGQGTELLYDLDPQHVVGLSDHYLVWVDEDLPAGSVGAAMFGETLERGYYLLPRFRHIHRECLRISWGAFDRDCGSPELADLEILRLDDAVGLRTLGNQGLFHPLGAGGQIEW